MDIKLIVLLSIIFIIDFFGFLIHMEKPNTKIKIWWKIVPFIWLFKKF